MPQRLLSVLMALLMSILGLSFTAHLEAAQPSAPGPPSSVAVCGDTSAVTSTPNTAPPMPALAPDVSTPVTLQTVADVPLPGSASRFDYQSFDSTTGRLYIAHMGAGEVDVFDTASQTVVGTVTDLPTVTGVLVVPDLKRVYAAVAGSHEVAVIDTETLTVIERLGEIGFPDGLDFAPEQQRVFVSDESGGGELVIDATTNTVVTTIDLGGEAGNTHYDAGSGCILVAVQTRDELVAIDPDSLAIVGRYDMGIECQSPHGFLVDALARRAFVTCEDNATMQVVDLTTMRVTDSLPTAEGPDVLALDPDWHRLYVAAESGAVSIFDTRAGTVHPVGDYQFSRAHSISVDPATHLLYLPLEDVDGQPVLRIMESTPPGS